MSPSRENIEEEIMLRFYCWPLASNKKSAGCFLLTQLCLPTGPQKYTVELKVNIMNAMSKPFFVKNLIFIPPQHFM